VGKKPMTLAPAALEALLTYSWPGNVRELQNCLERAVILSDGDTIHPTHLSLSTEVHRLVPEAPLANLDLSGTLADVMVRATEAVERQAIARALLDANGDTARAADRLQLGFKALVAKMRQYGLS
jgi:two-component system response regulator AtoC